MLSINQIRKFYPENLHPKSSFLLREYLQFKILELLFESEYADKFAFLGGSCLRIVHQNSRFSEDLDFDNFNLTEADFVKVSEIIKIGLENQGYQIEIRNVMRSAFHCYVKFPGLLFSEGLSPHQEAKITINLDTDPQHFYFQPETPILNKFEVITRIKTTPIDLLLSQKFVAITQRKRAKGRDFFDVVFLLAQTKPNYEFLKFKLNLESSEELRTHILMICEKLDFVELAKEVAEFVFDERDLKRVLYFKEYFKTVEL